MTASRTLLVTVATLSLSLFACGDDGGGSGGNGGSASGGSSTGGSATGAANGGGAGGSGATSGGGSGGMGTGATGTGASGTGGSVSCARCGDAIGESFPLFCDTQAEQLYDTLESCMCTFACTLNCEFDACDGSEPSIECVECLELDCQPQYDDCLADS